MILWAYSESDRETGDGEIGGLSWRHPTSETMQGRHGVPEGLLAREEGAQVVWNEECEGTM